MFHRRRSGLRRSDRPGSPRKGHAISGPGRHSGNGSHNRNPRRRVHVRRGLGSGEAAAGHPRVDRGAALQTSILTHVPGRPGGGPPSLSRSESMRSENAIMPQAKNLGLSSWDVVYALNMALACLITYWIMTHILSRFVDESVDFLGGMWAVVATVFVFRETRLRKIGRASCRER